MLTELSLADKYSRWTDINQFVKSIEEQIKLRIKPLLFLNTEYKLYHSMSKSSIKSTRRDILEYLEDIYIPTDFRLPALGLAGNALRFPV